jgi:peptidyl-tRNA hydrolase
MVKNADYPKLLLGISRPVSRNPEDVAKYVLGKFKEEEIIEYKTDIFLRAEDLVKKEFINI